MATLLKKILHEKVVVLFDDTITGLNLEPSECAFQCREINKFSLFKTLPLEQLSDHYLNAKKHSSHRSSLVNARFTLALYKDYQTEIEHETRCLKFQSQQIVALDCVAT